MDSFGAFLDTQLLRVERLLREETESERINRRLQRESAEGVDVGESTGSNTVTPFYAMRQIAAAPGGFGAKR